MTFLNPFILLGLLAAAIPLIIHLFHFRRPRRVDFSSLVFLRELQQRTMRRMRIQQWLLLLLRTLAIACLVIGFAGPTIRHGGTLPVGARTPTSAVLLLDNSLSMTVRDAGGPYLQQAREMAHAVLQEMQPGDEIFLHTSGEAPDDEPFRSPEGARAALDAIQPRAHTRMLFPALAEALTQLQNARHPLREVYVFSDLQESTLGPVQPSEEPPPTNTRIWLLPVGTENPDNLAVSRVSVQSRIVEQGLPVRIEATVANWGSTAVSDYVVSLYLDDERVAQNTVSLPAGGEITTLFTVTPRRRGWLQGRVEIEEDAFPRDNTGYVTLYIPERRNILLVRGQEPTTYVEVALSLRPDGRQEVFHLTTIDEEALSGEHLEAYAVVILAGVRDLSSGERARLQAYLENGGGVVFFPSADMPLEDCNALLSTWGGGRVTRLLGTPGSTTALAELSDFDLEHPLYEGVFRALSDLQQRRVEPARIFAALAYEPGSPAEQTLARLSTGQPFLEELPVGRGRVLFFTGYPDVAWTDLPLRGLFVPLLYRVLYYASAPHENLEGPSTVGEPLVLALPPLSSEMLPRVVTPSGEEQVPLLRTLPGQLQLTLSAPEEPGFYRVLQGDTLLRLVAVNLPPEESRLKLADPEILRAQMEEMLGVPVRLLDVRGRASAEAVEKQLSEARKGTNLWNVFLALALLFLITEVVVSRGYRQQEPSHAAS